jgi:predicted nucleic acid-binding protein
MIPRNSLIILDSLALFSLCTGHSLGAHLNSQYSLNTWQPRPLVSITTVGEILRIANYSGYSEQDIAAVETLVNNFQIVNVLPDIAYQFGFLGGALDARGQRTASSKLWVGATARALGEGTLNTVILCCDSDYKAFQADGVNIEFVDPVPFLKVEPFPF